MTYRFSAVVRLVVFVLIVVGLAQPSLAFPPPTQANPSAQYTAAINVDYANVQTFTNVLSFDPSNPIADYPKLYWFKYTSDGHTVVKFDTLGSNFGSSGGGTVLGIHNDSQIA